MWRMVRVATGFSLILLGAIGTLVPVVPGVPMVLAGIALVGTDHPWIRAVRTHWGSDAAGPKTARRPAPQPPICTHTWESVPRKG